MATDPEAPSPRPFRQFVLKVHGRCDLACDHCYVYEHADQSWRRRSRAMSAETVRLAAERIAEHAGKHRLPGVRVVLHGGEPLLLGLAGLRATLAAVRDAIDPVTHLDLRMQSNGVLLSEAFCDILLEYDVRLGISLDGDRAANDLHRRFANGATSYDQVIRALELLRRPRYRRVYAGLLCTVDLRNDPIEVYEALIAQRPPRLDLLLPHATWDTPPLRPGRDVTPYATWLRSVFDRWTADGRRVPIRLFDSLLSTAEGGPSGSEWVGLDPTDLAVIETDGDWEQADSLKTAFDGAPSTGFSINSHSADEIASLPDFVAAQRGIGNLGPTCRACAVVRQCGGGLMAHRFRTGAGFEGPSVYCDDLKGLILHMNDSSRRMPVATAGLVADDPLAGLIDQIGSGRGDDASIGYLADVQWQIARTMMAAVAQSAAARPMTQRGWEILADLERTAPEATRSVLSHPYLRSWAVRCLTAAETGEFGESDHLARVAAAAASAAGASVELDLPLRGKRAHLPTLGTLALPFAVSDTAQVSIFPHGLTVRCDARVIEIDLDAGESDHWKPAKWITIDGIRLLLEDADPYRDCHSWQVHEWMNLTELDAWRHSIMNAWTAIMEEVPEQGHGLRRGLRAITPLQADPMGTRRASTSRNAFGAVATQITDPAALSMMIVHEFQHSKLGALLDLCDLVDPSDQQLLSVGWRTDRRPVEAALQGAYAHLAVAEIWQVRAAERRGSAREAAAMNYRQYRSWTADAIAALVASDALTPSGNRLVTRMAESMKDWPI